MQPSISFQTGQKIVHSKYSVCHQIGAGSHSSVYSISLKKKGRVIMRAAKVEYDKVTTPQISTEISVLKCIQGTHNADIGFAKFFEYGFEAEYNYLVMELLGPNLEQLMKLSGGKLALKTVLILGLQMIDRIEVLHTAGFIYKDIKPQNFVMGLQNKSHILHLIDFGKCKRYKNNQTGKHLPYKQNCRFDGEHMFSSINTHTKTEFSRRDDIQALVYLMIYLRKGKLPWCSSKEFKSKKQRDTLIEEIKKKITLEQLTYKLPLTFIDLLCYVRTLNYYEKPDYDYIRLLLHRGFSAEEDNLSMVFDWNKIDHLDFAIYAGEPKIVLRPEGNKNGQSAGEEQIEKKQGHNMQLKESNSIDMQVMINKKANQTAGGKDGIVQTREKSSNRQSVRKSQKKQIQQMNGLNLFLGLQ